ncbi:UNVERIFIED_CONTAM: hypothetical protein FKN15_006909 [Acipenser sinensis]
MRCTVLYGLSSYRGSLRMKRSVERVRSEGRAGAGSPRCSCVERGDPHCESFCRERYKGDSAQQKRLRGESFLATDSRTGLFTAARRYKGDSAQQKRLRGESFLATDSRTGLFTVAHR